jgi:L-lactate utilization protein LutB
MKKQILSEEFTRMQKLAGVINETISEDKNELEAFKQFMISELDEVLEEYIKNGENLFGEPFDANEYEELKNSINNSTTIDDIDEIVEDYLYENVYEKDYEVKDFFKYIYKTFYKQNKK